MFIANCRSVAPILKEIQMDDLSQVQGATDLQLVLHAFVCKIRGIKITTPVIYVSGKISLIMDM